ncbi:MAG: DNA polymerase III subunit delta [Phycisphaerae bacterium]|nr:DNA polymerase III subunit delta [Phycisphaerae bacterium]
MATKSQKRTDKPAPLYAVCGEELFLRRQAITELVDEVLGPADRSLAMSEYDGKNESLKPADVLDDLRTLPFLVERKLVLLRDGDLFVKQYRAELEAYAEKPCERSVFVLECKSLSANTRLYKRIAAAGEVVKCEPIKAYQVPAWLTDRAKQTYGKRLTPKAAAMLCDLIGPELGQLDAELQKLTVYVNSRDRIDIGDVEALGGRCREEQVWGILSAIAAGDRAKALFLWEEVWQTDRAANGRAIGGLAYSVRRLLAAKRAELAGAPLDELRKLMMIWRDDPRLQRELNAFSVDQIEQMLCRLLDADVAAKSGGMGVRSSIETFIVELCQPRKKVGA